MSKLCKYSSRTYTLYGSMQVFSNRDNFGLTIMFPSNHLLNTVIKKKKTCAPTSCLFWWESNTKYIYQSQIVPNHIILCPPGVSTSRARIYLAHYLSMPAGWHGLQSQLPSSAGSGPKRAPCINFWARGGLCSSSPKGAWQVDICQSRYAKYHLWPCMKARFLLSFKEFICRDKG